MGELYRTEASELENFIQGHLQPNVAFLRQVDQAVDIICGFLREYHLLFPLCRVVKGGSLGKGTALKGDSDTDLVVFLGTFRSFADHRQKRKEAIEDIRKMLLIEGFLGREWLHVDIEPVAPENPRALRFKLRSSDLRDDVSFDVLPAFDALGRYRKGQKPSPSVYIDLITCGCVGGELSACFTELQRDFIIDRPLRLKKLIRLVKRWYKEYVSPYEAQLRSEESLPPKYALELLAVYAWERGGKKPDFDMAEAFRTVLWLVQNYGQLCIFWTTYYDFEDATLSRYLTRQLQKPRPVILDPADPTGILGEGSRWDLLAQEADRCACQNCCILSWSVLLQRATKKPPRKQSGSGFKSKLLDTCQSRHLYLMLLHLLWLPLLRSADKTLLPQFRQVLLELTKMSQITYADRFMDLFTKEAERGLYQVSLKGNSGFLVPHWDVPLQVSRKRSKCTIL